MTVLAVLLAAVGVADLARRGWRYALAIVVTIGGLLALGAGWHTAWLTLLIGIVVVVWVDAAEHDSLAGSVLFAAAVVTAVVAAPAFDFVDAPVAGWYASLPVPGLATVPLEHAALALGVLLFLATAANVVVRQALSATGPLVLREEHVLRGGRLIGPLERWFVFGFAAGGHLGAIAAVVAAKGILRFPEISRDEPDGMRAEYVLVGSFVSWALALAFVPLF